jgi:TNF receptor-associated protein 1
MTTETPHQHAFEAEVQQVLDIVINSLYTDREVFIRELVSNASDALEKLRHVQHTERDIFDEELPLEINITTDEEAKTITISDYGVGMTREELTENLGTIAHSGSKKFIQALADNQRKDASLIGQFGVGFYSAFIAAKEVKVYTHSWRQDGESLCWSSDGKSGYDIEEVPGQRRGAKVVVELLDECADFSKGAQVRTILENYSSFVPFPILLNGERVNKVEALWLKSKKEISEEEYTEFYRFTANAFDDPLYRMHFSADAPIMINALLFVPGDHPERFGMGQMEPGVDLYCKKVLIEAGPKQLLPDWLRFLKGVIDSEDLPLNISRESMQDSTLVRKIGQVVTKRFLKFLGEQAKDDAEKYGDFYDKFGRFIKEGIATDFDHRESLAKLLRFESSMTEPGEKTGLEEYLTRAKDEQDQIYYLVGRSRGAIEAGPYLEAFKARGLEVIYFFEPIDEYVTGSLNQFEGKTLTAVDSADVKLGDLDAPLEGEALSDEESESLCTFMKDALGESVEKVEVGGSRLLDSPAIALVPQGGLSPQMRQMMRAMNEDGAPALKVNLELNPRHPLIRGLAEKREADAELAKLVCAQILDNALLSAGLLEESKDTVQRMYEIMVKALGNEGGSERGDEAS